MGSLGLHRRRNEGKFHELVSGHLHYCPLSTIMDPEGSGDWVENFILFLPVLKIYSIMPLYNPYIYLETVVVRIKQYNSKSP